MRSGAITCGIVSIPPEGVSDSLRLHYRRYLEAGYHAGMTWMERNNDIRQNPALLLPGAQSIIVCAYPYLHPHTPHDIAPHACGQDYHKVLPDRLKPVQDIIANLYPGTTSRICTDSTPLSEKYWAVLARIGTIGRNSLIYTPVHGSRILLAEITTDAVLSGHTTLPSQILNSQCNTCNKCIQACPNRAISHFGTIDARRCLSYLTIEHRGPLPEHINPGHTLFGCDICQKICPLNNHTPYSGLPEFTPLPELTHLREQLPTLTNSQYRRLTADTAIARTSLKQLRTTAKAQNTVKYR